MKNLLRFQAKVFAITAILLVSISGILSAQKIAIIDAGSSGSRLYVYEIKIEEDTISTLYPPESDKSKWVALSSVANQEDSIKAFLDTMTSKFSPQDTIPLYILATAGMRKKGQKTADEIYCKMKFKNNNYDLKKAMTISGRYEGFYAWIAANYKSGKIKIGNSKTGKAQLECTKDSLQDGIVEIGGVSMQIAFAANKTNESDTINFVYRTGLGNIYSESFLGGGVESIYNKNKNIYDDKDKRPNFSIGLNDRSYLYKKDLKFFGLGKPLEKVLNNAASKGTTVLDYRNDPTLIRKKDTPGNFHPWINAQYIAWVVRALKLEGRLMKQTNKSDWTQGAALDIIVNKKEPEKFDYSKPY